MTEATLRCAIKDLRVECLSGLWYVVMSNMSKWRNRKSMTMNFSVVERRSPAHPLLIDRIEYIRQRRLWGKRRDLRHVIEVGVSEQHDTISGALLRKKKRFITGIKSRNWCVAALGSNLAGVISTPSGPDECEWAVLYFDRTWTESEGVAILSRTVPLARTSAIHIRNLLGSDPFLRTVAAGVYPNEHNLSIFRGEVESQHTLPKRQNEEPDRPHDQDNAAHASSSNHPPQPSPANTTSKRATTPPHKATTGTASPLLRMLLVRKLLRSAVYMTPVRCRVRPRAPSLPVHRPTPAVRVTHKPFPPPASTTKAQMPTLSLIRSLIPRQISHVLCVD
eukprot:Opistho-2@84850